MIKRIFKLKLTRSSISALALVLSGCISGDQPITGVSATAGSRTIAAPAPMPVEEAYNGALASKLAQRRTINAFLAWNQNSYSISDYGLRWTSQPRSTAQSISLAEVYWNYHYPGKPHSDYPGIQRFLTENNWGHAAEYGRTLEVDYTNDAYPQYVANLVASRAGRSRADGVMFDWWHNNHPVDLSSQQVSKARRSIAQAVRSKMGSDFIILGNTNWDMDRSNHDLINGVYLELYKKHSGAYTTGEIAKIEELLIFHNRHLAQPKLIALEPWRITRAVSDEDRNSAENRKYAKLFAAMSSVIPQHGYVLYADNNRDSRDGDHAHLFYDFYNFDLGRPTSSMTTIRSGLAYKAYENGLIAYNRTTKSFDVDFNGRSVMLGPLQGVFCREVSEQFQCV